MAQKSISAGGSPLLDSRLTNVCWSRLLLHIAKVIVWLLAIALALLVWRAANR